MSNKQSKIIVVFLLILLPAAGMAQAQVRDSLLPARFTGSEDGQGLTFLEKSAFRPSRELHFEREMVAAPSFRISSMLPQPPVITKGNIPAADTYTRNFGFFCRKELQFEKLTKLPLRLRVGSLEQCNTLEQKK